MPLRERRCCPRCVRHWSRRLAAAPLLHMAQKPAVLQHRRCREWTEHAFGRLWDMLSPSEVSRRCATLGGIARTAELAADGVSRHALAAAVQAGAIYRIREGVFAHPNVPAAARHAATHGGMLCCFSAAEAAGIWVVPYTGVHVAVPMRGRLHKHDGCTCVTHRTSGAVVLGGRSTVARALREILRCAGPEAFFVALESARKLRRVRDSDLAPLRSSIPLHHRWIIEFARDDADSGLESMLRFRLHAYGIELRSQVDVPGVGRVDFVLGDRLILEVDGKWNHESPPKRHKDYVRDAIAVGLGFDTLRFDYALVVHDWPTVLGAILGKLDAGLHRRTGDGVRFG